MQTIIDRERAKRSTDRDRIDLARRADEIRDRCKSLKGFIREAWHILEPGTPYVYGWHIGAISEHLEAITRGQITRLQINEPPGCMKSLVASVMWEAWEWGPAAMAWLRYLTTSYKFEYAERDSRKHRDLVMSEWYQTLWPKVQLTRFDSTDFENSERGGRRASAFQSLTGGRGNRVVMDDPHSVEDVESEKERQKAIFRFRECATSRVNDPRKDAILVIMHRLHPKDVCGMIEELGLDYVKLVLPMEYEPKSVVYSAFHKDPRTRAGELLFPEFFTPAAVKKQKAELTAHAFATQYQQQGSARAGGTFQPHWFNVIPALPSGPAEWVRGWDLAGTEEKKNKRAAFTAGVLLGKYPDGRLVVADARRGQVSPAGAERMVKNTATQDTEWVSDNGGGTYLIDIPQDPGQAGKSQVRYYVTNLAGFTIRWGPETGSKEVRADPVSSQAEIGNISLLHGQWNTAFLEELCAFPNGAYKDQVDALSRAFARLVKPGGSGVGMTGPRVINPDGD